MSNTVRARKLSDEDKEVLLQYEKNARQINSSLARNCITDADEAFACKVDEVLAKVDNYEGFVMKDTHGTSYNEEQTFFNRFCPGVEVTFHCFLRCYAKRSIIDNNASFVLKIKKCTLGKDLRDLHDGEGEILYPRETRFMCDKIKEEDGFTIIYLSEVK